jgi:uncharacterized protein (TIGR02271 family)
MYSVAERDRAFMDEIVKNKTRTGEKQSSEQRNSPSEGTHSEVVAVVPVIEETPSIRKEKVTTGKIRVERKTTRELKKIQIPVKIEEIEIKRIPFNERVVEIPQTRVEGDTTIIPLIEERIVMERHYILKEEVRVRRVVREEINDVEAEVGSQDITIERD